MDQANTSPKRILNLTKIILLTASFFLLPVSPLLIFHPEFVPAARAAGYYQRGQASYYGAKYHGRPTANGETFNQNALTAAHPSLPFGTVVQVKNPANGRTVSVRINDRGPFVGGRIIDLSRAAASELGLIQSGVGTVEIYR